MHQVVGARGTRMSAAILLTRESQGLNLLLGLCGVPIAKGETHGSRAISVVY